MRSLKRPLFSALTLVAVLLATLAATIKVDVDDTAGGKHSDAEGEASLGPANFARDDYPFSSRGWANGSIIKNKTKKKIEDLHIKLKPPDKIDPKSSCGGAFTKTVVSADGSEMTCSGGPGIAAGDSFWMMIPLSKPFDGGTGTFSGNLTPTPPPTPTPTPMPTLTPAPPTPTPAPTPRPERTSAPGTGGGELKMRCLLIYEARTVMFSATCGGPQSNPSIGIAPFYGVTPFEKGGARLPLALRTTTMGISQGRALVAYTAVGGAALYSDTRLRPYDSVITGQLLYVDVSRRRSPPFLRPAADNPLYLSISSSILSASQNLRHDARTTATLSIAAGQTQPATVGYFSRDF